MSIKPVSIFIGNDEKKSKSLIKDLENKFSIETDREFYFAEETPVQEILSSINNLSLFGKTKIVKVYNFEKHIKEFANYSQEPNNLTYLFLISFKEAKELEDKIIKSMNKTNYSLIISETKKGAESELFSRLNALNIKLSNDARTYLAKNFEKEGDIDDLIEIFSSLPEKENGLTIEDILPYVSGEKKIFVFIDSVFSKDFKNSLFEFEKLISLDEEFISILYQLYNRLKLIWNVKAYYESGMNKGEISSKLGKYPFLVDKCIKESRNYNFERLKVLLEEIQKADVFIKSRDKYLHKIYFEKLILLLCE